MLAREAQRRGRTTSMIYAPRDLEPSVWKRKGAVSPTWVGAVADGMENPAQTLHIGKDLSVPRINCGKAVRSQDKVAGEGEGRRSGGGGHLLGRLPAVRERLGDPAIAVGRHAVE